MLVDSIRGCQRCDLRPKCTAPVPGNGLSPSPIMFIGEAPGEEEDQSGFPFKGKAGRLLNSMIGTVDLSRESVFVTNVVKCRPSGNKTPLLKYAKECASWLNLEIAMVQPRILVLLGAVAIQRMGFVGTVEHLHGKPIRCGDKIYLPTYHPAAALHNTSNIRHLFDDFEILRRLLSGAAPEDLIPVDQFPDPRYKQTEGDQNIDVSLGKVAIDVEVVDGKIWSLQLTGKPGEAWFARPNGEESARMKMPTIVHNYLYDSQFVDIPNPIDTMVMAYLLGLPQGLKELASRLCGMEMRSYSDVTLPGRRMKSIKYLTNAAAREWPDPDPIPETRWDNKAGCVTTKDRKPQNVGRKIKRIIADCVDNPNLDPYHRWTQIDERERLVVESELGALPDSNLADIPIKDVIQYSCRDADATLRVYLEMQKRITDLGLDFVLNCVDMPILPMVREMMDTGIAIDRDYFLDLSAVYQEKMTKAASQAAGKASHSFNPNSSAQVASIVYGELGFKATAFTPSGLISTDDRELKKVNHPIIEDILEYRQQAKMKDSYADALASRAVWDPITSTHRIHTTLKTTRTETGRLSSSDPNLQGIPIREGPMIRRGFVVTPGSVMLGADYDQQEARVMAHASRCKALIDLFLRGEDVHTATAARIFGIPESEARLVKYRYPTKRLNFGVIYDISPEGLAADIEESSYGMDVVKWSVKECKELIQEWYRLYLEVRDFKMEKASQARRCGYVTDMFGRIRYTPEILCPIRSIQEAGVRQAGNMPIQSGSAGITKLAMSALYRSRPSGVKFLLQIHDELLLEAPEHMKDLCMEWLSETMTDIVKLSVPLTVSVKAGANWGGLTASQV